MAARHPCISQTAHSRLSLFPPVSFDQVFSTIKSAPPTLPPHPEKDIHMEGSNKSNCSWKSSGLRTNPFCTGNKTATPLDVKSTPFSLFLPRNGHPFALPSTPVLQSSSAARGHPPVDLHASASIPGTVDRGFRASGGGRLEEEAPE